MKCHKVKVLLSAAARGRVWIDGQEVPHVRSVKIRGAVDEVSSVELELTAVEIEAEVLPDLPTELRALAGVVQPSPTPSIDWGQYRLNGGSYCMHVYEGESRYCGRAEAWAGHNSGTDWPNHNFVDGCPEPG
jgi:hypothetical protein